MRNCQIWRDGSGENMTVDIASRQNHATNGAKRPIQRGWLSMGQQKAVVGSKKPADK